MQLNEGKPQILVTFSVRSGKFTRSKHSCLQKPMRTVCNYQNSPNYYRSLNGWTSSSDLLLCSECSSWKDESGVKRRSSFCPIFTRHRHADLQCWVWSFNWILLLTTRKIYDITFKARVVKLFSKHIYDLFVENLSVTDLQQQTRNQTLWRIQEKNSINKSSNCGRRRPIITLPMNLLHMCYYSIAYIIYNL